MSAERVFTGPLSGIRVVDFGHYFAAPMAAGLLADQGADVVRVLRPGEPELPPAQMRWLNRNKRIVTLDLTSKEGQRDALALVARADIVVESFRPGVMARWGLDYASLASGHPGLIYLSLPGFASSDVERSGIQAWEGVVSAAASLYTSGIRQRLGFPPQYIPLPACSAFASVHGAIAIASALVARERTGRGTQIEVPLVNAGISTCTRSFVYDGGALRAETRHESELSDFLKPLQLAASDDSAARRAKQAEFAGLAPPIFTTRQYRTLDDRRILVMPIKPGMVKQFFELLGLLALLEGEGFVIENSWSGPSAKAEKNLASSWTLSRDDSLRVIAKVEEAIALRSAAHWERVLGEAGIPIGVRRTRAEWLADPGLRKAGLLSEMDDGNTCLVGAGCFVDLSEPGGARPVFIPREPEPVDPADLQNTFRSEGEDARRPTAESELAFDRKADLLGHLRVLDLCNVVAGPNAAYTLAQFGADVVRVEPPESFNLPMHHEWTLEVNQGKRSVVLDTRTDRGREVFERLVRQADLIIHNRLENVAERLGQSAKQLQAINPKAVVCEISAYGGGQSSEWDRIPGYDPMPNLATGLDDLAGTEDAPRAMVEIFADLMSGLGASFAGLLGLFERERSGFAPVGRASLARAAHHYQFPYLLSENGQSDWGQGSGPEALGDAPWQRMFETADGWLFVGAKANRWNALVELVTGDPEANRANSTNEADQAAIEASFAGEVSQAWVKRLLEAGFGCHAVLSIADLCDPGAVRAVGNGAQDEHASGALDVLCWPDHPSGIPVLLPAPAWVQIGETRSYQRLAPTPIVGADTRDVLVELGYGADEIEDLYTLGVAHDYLPAIGARGVYFFRPEKSEES